MKKQKNHIQLLCGRILQYTTTCQKYSDHQHQHQHQYQHASKLEVAEGIDFTGFIEHPNPIWYSQQYGSHLHRNFLAWLFTQYGYISHWTSTLVYFWKFPRMVLTFKNCSYSRAANSFLASFPRMYFWQTIAAFSRSEYCRGTKTPHRHSKLA